MKSFARTTKLPSISGRAGYMSDPGKQEEIVLESEKVDWQPYVDFEATQHKTNARQNEGREMMVSLPNDWYQLPKDELRNRVDLIAKTTVGKDRDYQWAVHWNKDRTNLHVHIIFSERQRVKEPARWDRDIYLTQDGKVARRKADRAREPDGSFKPPIHKKGDLKTEPFTAKDANFKSKAWLHEKKQELKQLMVERWDVKFEKQPHLPEFHQGKGDESETIAKKNIVVRENNRRLDFLESQGVNISGLVRELKAARNDAKSNPDMKDRTALLWQDSKGEYKVTAFFNPDRAITQMEQTAWRFEERKVEEVRPDPEPEKAAPEVPAVSDLKQEPPEIPVVSDKKEVNRELVAPVERKSFFERIRDTFSSFMAQRAEKAAQRAAAEQAKKVAEEQARKAAAEQAAAQRAAALAAQQQRMAAIDGLKQTVEDRWKTAEQKDFRGWRSADGERALADMRKDGSAFPVIYKDDFGWRIKIFSENQWQQAKSFADQTENDFKGLEKEARISSLDKYIAEMEKICPQVEERLKAKQERESQSKGWDR